MASEGNKVRGQLKVTIPDNLDKRILDHLRMNARIPHTQLARLIGLSTTACKHRISKLEKFGIIAKYTIIIGSNSPMMRKYILIELVSTSNKIQNSFVNYLKSRGDVISIDLLEGDYDYMIQIEEYTIGEHKDVVADLNMRKEVRRTRTISVMNTIGAT